MNQKLCITIYLISFFLFVFDSYADWIHIPGSAYDIAAGNGDTVWVIGTDKEEGGYGIHKWDGNVWTKINGGAVRISVDINGNPWVVNSNGNIFKLQNNNWILLPGLASDIANGKDGSVWIVGVNKAVNGNDILNWNNHKSDWVKVSASGSRISIDKDGIPWIVGSDGTIYKYISGMTTQHTGFAMDVGGNKYSDTWVIGTDIEFGGYGIHRWVGDKWDKIPGGAKNITVDDYGRAWVVNSDNGIYRYSENNTNIQKNKVTEVTTIQNQVVEQKASLPGNSTLSIADQFMEYLTRSNWIVTEYEPSFAKAYYRAKCRFTKSSFHYIPMYDGKYLGENGFRFEVISIQDNIPEGTKYAGAFRFYSLQQNNPDPDTNVFVYLKENVVLWKSSFRGYTVNLVLTRY